MTTGAIVEAVIKSVIIILFLLTGLMSGIAAVCLTSRLGSTRPSIDSAVPATCNSRFSRDTPGMSARSVMPDASSYTSTAGSASSSLLFC